MDKTLTAPKAAHCERCGTPVGSIQLLPGASPISPRFCDLCLVIEKKLLADENQKATREAAMEKWLKLCPPQYEATEVEKLPCPRESLTKVLNWQFGPRGMLIGGQTSRGKTRAAMLLMRRLMIQDGLTIRMFLDNSFSRECSASFGEGEGVAWIKKAMEADVVFIDDLGKFRMTDRVESELFGLIEHRTSWNRPLIVTMNATVEVLKGMLSEDRGAPLLRRIREFCEPIMF